MAGLGTAFNPNEVDPDKGGGSFVLAPEGPGEYEITESDVKPTAKGTGLVASFIFVGTGDDNKGARIYFNCNVQNDNAQAQAIGQAQLSALCKAADFNEALEDTNQLHFRPLWIDVKHEQQMKKGPSGKYDQPQFNDDGSPRMRAEVKRFLFEGCDDDKPAAANQPATKSPPAAAAPAPSGKPKRPWERAA